MVSLYARSVNLADAGGDRAFGVAVYFHRPPIDPVAGEPAFSGGGICGGRRKLTDSIKKWIITGGGLGLLKPAPGSWGSCGPALIWWMLLWLNASPLLRTGVSLMVILAAGFFTVRLGPWAESYFGKKDPGQVVLDEYAGYLTATLLLPVPGKCIGHLWGAWIAAAVVYVLFRLTDTLKLPPCRQLEQLPAGWGVFWDDIAAGLQVNILLQIVLRIALH
jgi:phosphatidylglycerophosphatase A